MNDETSIIPHQAAGIALTPKGEVALRNVGEAAGFAQLMAQSGTLPKGISPQFATIAIVAGAPLGLNPFESVQSIAVINGRPSLYGDAFKGVVTGSGLHEDEKVEWFTNAQKQKVAVRVTVKRKGRASPIIGEFSETMARRAGLWGKPGPWTQYPDRMLLARARAFAYRDGFADVLKGIRSAEEEQDIILAEQAGSESAQKESKRGRMATASEIIAIPAPAEPVAEVPPAEAPENAPAGGGTPAGGGADRTGQGTPQEPADFLS